MKKNEQLCVVELFSGIGNQVQFLDWILFIILLKILMVQ